MVVMIQAKGLCPSFACMSHFHPHVTFVTSCMSLQEQCKYIYINNIYVSRYSFISHVTAKSCQPTTNYFYTIY
jgi:hypothetical protein